MGTDVSPISIEALRASDQKGAEVVPEQQTINDHRLRLFLNKNGVNSDNWEKTFTLELATRFMAEGRTTTEQDLKQKFEAARSILNRYPNHNFALSDADLMREKDESVVTGRLENLKTAPTNMPPSDAARVLQAWGYFNLIRQHSWRLMQVEASTKQAMQSQLEGKKSPTEDVTGAIQEMLGKGREHWDKLPGSTKLLTAGAALFGAVMFLTHENETVKGIREKLWTGVKILGGGWLANKLWYLLSGETIIDYVTGAGKPTAGKSKFLAEVFKTDEAGGDTLAKAFVMMGENSFMELLAQYEAAVKAGKVTIEGTKMPAREAFAAMDIFCKKYGNLEKLKLSYAKYNPPISFSSVVATEMANDPDVKLEESVTSRIYDGTADLMRKGSNYLSSTWLGTHLTSWYEKEFGKKPTPQQLQEYGRKFGEMVQNEADVAAKIESLVPDKKQAAEFQQADRAGVLDSKHGLKCRTVAQDAYYIVVEKVFQPGGNEKALAEGAQAAVTAAKEFLKETHKMTEEKAAQVIAMGSVFVNSGSKMKYLLRCPM